MTATTWRHNQSIPAMNRKYPDTGLIPATTVNPCNRDEPFMDTRITPSARCGMALFREPDGASLAGDTFPGAQVKGDIPGQGHGDRGAARPVCGLHPEARRLHRRGQGHRGALSADLRVAEMDREAGHRQRDTLHRARDGSDTGLLHILRAGKSRRRHLSRHICRHDRGHIFRHLWGHFWGHILYR